MENKYEYHFQSHFPPKPHDNQKGKLQVERQGFWGTENCFRYKTSIVPIYLKPLKCFSRDQKAYAILAWNVVLWHWPIIVCLNYVHGLI